MSGYTPDPLVACTSLIIVRPGEEQSRDVTAFYTSFDDALESAITLIQGKGWHLGVVDGPDFAAGKRDGCILFDDDSNHVGAIYCHMLREPIIRPEVKFSL
ncbi:hypothetical protein SEA_SUPERCHUNK_92 [Mycobacterium phage Superchunk]|nr:hypothetical protein SEA_SUPERCHUNK_92 [Mycobacterium phage Superchunk]